MVRRLSPIFLYAPGDGRLLLLPVEQPAKVELLVNLQTAKTLGVEVPYSGYGGADMPLTGPIPEGRTFFCPHCGALYSVTYSRLSKSDSNIAKCVVCLQIMTSWASTKIPTTSSCSDPNMPHLLRKRPREP